MKRKLLLVIFLLFAFYANAQNRPTAPFLDSATVNFFVGKWIGVGKFASDKSISSDLLINATLDGAWLEISHTDRPPNSFKAKSYWGVDRETGQVVAYIFDNFHGHRQFSTVGWKNNVIVLSSSYHSTKRGMVYEHFIYEKLTPNSFKMTFETSKDDLTWKLGDWLIFTRQ